MLSRSGGGGHFRYCQPRYSSVTFTASKTFESKLNFKMFPSFSRRTNTLFSVQQYCAGNLNTLTKIVTFHFLSIISGTSNLV